MNISYNWLKQYIDFSIEPVDLARILTDTGLEVEGIEEFVSVKGGLEGVIIGRVLSCIKHPNADKLSVTTVDIGDDEPVQIVCGAPNVAEGQTVPVASVGTTLYPTGNEEGFTIKKQAMVILAENSTSHTLTTLPDDFLHFSEPRILTVREYARLQSFPDWFSFKGKYTTGGARRKEECPRYTQVGNAVPPLLSRYLGNLLLRICKNL